MWQGRNIFFLAFARLVAFAVAGSASYGVGVGVRGFFVSLSVLARMMDDRFVIDATSHASVLI